MQKTTNYRRVFFDVPLFESLFEEFQSIVQDPGKTRLSSLSVQREEEMWSYDSIAEFYSDLRKPCEYVTYSLANERNSIGVTLSDEPAFLRNSRVEIKAESREIIMRLDHIFESASERCFLPISEKPPAPAKKPKIFIGHGQSNVWRDVKDHLHDLHGYDVIAYETGSRAGHTIRDVIAELLENASFAILVMTGEDRFEDGSVGARPNVIHEIGLFQGRLGFTKAIVLLEEGTNEFSNLSGVNQIRFKNGNIRETFGDIIATLRREFPAVGA